MSMKFLPVLLLALMLPSALFAEDKPQPINIEQLLKDLRDLDSSTDMKGDHVVGEHLC